jgi:hypothetical protein
MPRDFSVINGIFQELRDEELALDRLDNSYDLLNHNWRDPTSKVRCYAEFKVRTTRVKELRDKAWRWLKENNFEPQPHQELERCDDPYADIPIHWEAEVVRLRSEIEDAVDELRRRDRQAAQAAGQAQLAIAPNLYLIHYQTHERLI